MAMMFTLHCLPTCGYATSPAPPTLKRGLGRLRRQKWFGPRAVQDEESTRASSQEQEQKVTNPGVDKKARKQEERERGQTTAIVTGAIAVALGVAYLVLVQLLDTRGVILVPPPPEAFDP